MNKLIDAIGSIDDKAVENALAIDSAEKLKVAVLLEKRSLRLRYMRGISALAACLCLMIFGGAVLRNALYHEKPVKAVSPITEVSSADEMKKYLGFDFPVLTEKSPDKYLIYSFNGEAQKGCVRYGDGSELSAAHGTGDISGIFGAKLTGSKTTDGISVYYYSMDNYNYAIWKHNGFSYCYIAAEDETDLCSTIGEIIEIIK